MVRGVHRVLDAIGQDLPLKAEHGWDCRHSRTRPLQLSYMNRKGWRKEATHTKVVWPNLAEASRHFVRLLPGSALWGTFFVQLLLASNLRHLNRCTAKAFSPKSAKTVVVWTGHAACGAKTPVFSCCLCMVEAEICMFVCLRTQLMPFVFIYIYIFIYTYIYVACHFVFQGLCFLWMHNVV